MKKGRGKDIALAVFLALAMFGFSARAQAAEMKKAVFAGGCFWSMEEAFEDVKGVTAAVSGFSGGTVKNPTYEQVCQGNTGHREAVQVTYDPAVITYAQLLDIYWHSIDPLDPRGQFCDKGAQYKSAIFYNDAEEMKLAEASRKAVQKELGHEVATAILPAAPFYPADAHHQDYAKRNPFSYGMYRRGCGKDNALRAIWGAKANTMPGF
ncbi:MAG: peptide-methionine (S)-S-oxide reductase MsrA [Alphaproteobacteria bacterium]|nr:peptide-methionine (S)-S-oxide reductase MsrA [Alphaproteobacteria bacterium]